MKAKIVIVWKVGKPILKLGLNFRITFVIFSKLNDIIAHGQRDDSMSVVHDWMETSPFQSWNKEDSNPN